MKSDKITVLDGAMGTELRKRGVAVTDYKSSIWSAFAITEDPEAIINLHSDYIKAGSDIITANNYAVTRPMLSREAMADQLPEMLSTAINLALEARARSQTQIGDRKVRVAASLPPLETSYRYDLVGSLEDNLASYREMVEVAAPKVDMFICETMTTAEEALAAATAGCESGKPTWVSWTLSPRHGNLRGGETIEQAVEALAGLPVAGFLFNCADCQTVTHALPTLKKLTDKPIGAYCNPVLAEPQGAAEPEHIPAAPLTAEEYADVAKA